ncbi:hypothetical protein Tco_1428980 [Tanacetum coccineum]
MTQVIRPSNDRPSSLAKLHQWGGKPTVRTRGNKPKERANCSALVLLLTWWNGFQIKNLRGLEANMQWLWAWSSVLKKKVDATSIVAGEIKKIDFVGEIELCDPKETPTFKRKKGNLKTRGRLDNYQDTTVRMVTNNNPFKRQNVAKVYNMGKGAGKDAFGGILVNTNVCNTQKGQWLSLCQLGMQKRREMATGGYPDCPLSVTCFDVIISMDWLRRCHAVDTCANEKLVQGFSALRLEA